MENLDLKELMKKQYESEIIGFCVGKTKGGASVAILFQKIIQKTSTDKFMDSYYNCFVKINRMGENNKYPYVIYSQKQLESFLIDVKDLSDRKFLVNQKVYDMEYFEIGKSLTYTCNDGHVQLDSCGNFHLSSVEELFKEVSFNEFIQEIGTVKGIFDE